MCVQRRAMKVLNVWDQVAVAVCVSWSNYVHLQYLAQAIFDHDLKPLLEYMALVGEVGSIAFYPQLFSSLLLSIVSLALYVCSSLVMA